MKVIIDSERFETAYNCVKVIVPVEGGKERHIAITDEGIIVDLVEREGGEVVGTMSITHEEMLEAP